MRAAAGRRRLVALASATGAFAALVVVTAWADDSEPVSRPAPHMDLKPPPHGAGTPGGARDKQPVFGPSPAAGQNPAAFADKGKILPEPERDAAKKDAEPVLGRGGFAADRDTETRMDRATEHDDELAYVTVFNPSVLPFKRMSALDAVAEDYKLYTSSRTLQDLPVGGSRQADRDLFWGSLVVQFTPGVDVPIPSVAADMRILSYEVEPRISSVTFSKDGADNYYVRTDETGATGMYRLVFLADADARYFGAKVPSGYTVREASRNAPADIVHQLPPRVQARAEQALDVLGLHRGVELSKALDKLVEYFRNFQPTAAPTPNVDIYWDLFINRAGVCRHRSFAFMITANALGIPTRYVTNEAHAFVEVWVPEVGWLRVDLGGAALRMQVSNARDKSIYRPRSKDSFPKPPQYANNYTRLEGDIRGLSQEQLDEAHTTVQEDDPSGLATGEGDSEPDAPRVGPGRSLPELPDSAVRGKAPTSIEVTSIDSIGYRGEAITTRGRMTSRANGVAGLRVDIYMAPAGFEGDDAVLVGHATTTADGTFTAVFELPKFLAPRDYEVYAATPGNDDYAPSVSE